MDSKYFPNLFQSINNEGNIRVVFACVLSGVKVWIIAANIVHKLVSFPQTLIVMPT